MDVIGLHAAGFTEAVAPLGTAVTAEQLRLLWRLAPVAILCFDQDAAGQRAAARAIERVLPLICAGNDLKIALLKTDTGDDPDQLARRYPRQFLEQAFADALPLSDVVYALERGGHAPRSAEEAAALEHRLVRRTAAVADPELRQHFRLAFRERVRRDLRLSQPPAPARGNRRGGPARSSPTGRLPDARIATATRPAAASGRWIEAEKHLLALILAHPADFPRHEEALGTLTFADAGFERLRQALILILSSTETPTAGELQSRLAAAGCAEPLSRVLEDPGVRLAAVNTAAAPAADREEYARAQIQLLRRRTLAQELTDAAGSQADFADEWARRQALIRARLDSEER
jgi:DNA primase